MIDFKSISRQKDPSYVFVPVVIINELRWQFEKNNITDYELIPGRWKKQLPDGITCPPTVPEVLGKKTDETYQILNVFVVKSYFDVDQLLEKLIDMQWRDRDKEYSKLQNTVVRIGNMKLGEFKDPKARKCIKIITDEIFPRENVSEKEAQGMAYTKLALLIGAVGGKPEYDDSNHDSWDEQRFQYSCVASALLHESRVSIPVKLFLMLKIGDFLDYMYVEEERTEEYSQYDRDCTIEKFLLEKNKEINRPWFPIDSMEGYLKRIRDAYDDIGQLFVSSFYLGQILYKIEYATTQEQTASGEAGQDRHSSDVSLSTEKIYERI